MNEEGKVAIVEIGKTLVAMLGGSIDDRSAQMFQAQLAERIAATRARGVVIDLATVDIVDSYIGRVLSDVASIARLLGARVVVTGMQPPVAITLVELGLTLPRIETALTTEAGLAMLGVKVDA